MLNGHETRQLSIDDQIDKATHYQWVSMRGIYDDVHAIDGWERGMLQHNLRDGVWEVVRIERNDRGIIMIVRTAMAVPVGKGFIDATSTDKE